MKTVYSQIDLINSWINSNNTKFIGYSGKQNISNYNKAYLFAEGDTIYSYGYHFPLAKKVFYKGKKYIIINSTNYSLSTNKHYSKLYMAIPDNIESIPIYYLHQSVTFIIKKMCTMISEYLAKITRAKVHKNFNLKQANTLRSNLLKYLSLPITKNYYISKEDEKLLANAYSFKNYKPISKEYLARQVVICKEKYIKWKNFKNNAWLGDLDYTGIRFNTETNNIETTLGIFISKSRVKFIYVGLLNNTPLIGKTIKRLSSIDRQTKKYLTIGCHKLLIKDILEIGKKIYPEIHL